jgi:peptidoglycan/xylan/chitin deacetylase (PgdA/CDA1 family)
MATWGPHGQRDISAEWRPSEPSPSCVEYPDLMVNRRSAALAAVGFLLYAGTVGAQVHTVAMTVDDLPFAAGIPALEHAAGMKGAEQVNETIVQAFTRHHVPATGFVIEQRAQALGLPVSKKILKEWMQPGFDLGNHLYSHPDVNMLSVDQIEREITRGEATFAQLLKQAGREPRFLRFPYNHTGDTKEKHDAISAFLSAHGYRIAPCTIDNSDYAFNTAYALALSLHDDQTAAKVKADYIAYTEAEIDWYTALDKQVFGYDIPHIMLLHANRLNAAAILDVLALFEQRWYRFVSLEEAVTDPAYAAPETYITKYGPMWGYRWAHEKNVKVNAHNEPDPPIWISQYVKSHQARQSRSSGQSRE